MPNIINKFKDQLSNIKLSLFKINTPKSLFLILSVLFIVMIFSSIAYDVLVPVNTNEIVVRIRQGESTKSIASKLKQNQVIRSAFWFDVLTRLSKIDRKLKSGRYVFGGNINLLQTITKIKEGHSTLIHLTIPEGFSLHRIVKAMEKHKISTYDSLMAIATNPVIVKQLTGQERQTLEGFLYPETYSFDIDLEIEQIFGLMTNQFFKRLKEAGIEINDERVFYNDLILASIVEQEAVKEEEKPLIAGVFLNRLLKGMKLESCPTVDYTLERKSIVRKKLTFNDLLVDTPYNTYRIIGLPPNPICNPSVSSLLAVMNPAKTSYLYFFADFQGQNVFSSSYKEHINKQKLHKYKS